MKFLISSLAIMCLFMTSNVFADMGGHSHGNNGWSHGQKEGWEGKRHHGRDVHQHHHHHHHVGDHDSDDR